MHVRRGATSAAVGVALLALTLIVSVTGATHATLSAPEVRSVGGVRIAPGEVVVPSGQVQVRGRVPSFRPTMNPADYAAAKAAAAATIERTGAKPGVTATDASPRTAPATVSYNKDGVSQKVAGGGVPDTTGAVGLTQVVEVTNRHVDVFDKSTGALLKSVTLASFFGFTATSLFDPRVVYDDLWNRWVVTADALHDTTTRQFVMVSASTTSDATGSFILRRVDVDFNNTGAFWDFPMLGMDQDAVIITGNIFASDTSSTYQTTMMMAVGKARLYNNIGQTVCMKNFGPISTIAPPIVQDQAAKTFIVNAPTSGNFLRLYSAQNLSRGVGCSVTGPTNITVGSYSVPAEAQQPDTTRTLDTSDSRFEAPSAQVGSALWQVHTITTSDTGGFPAPRFYQINTSTNSVTQSGFFFKGSTSYDWNASITANPSKEAFVTWTATDPTNNVNAQVRYSGRQSTDTAGVIGPGASLFTSSTFYDPGANCSAPATCARWGDYSGISLDPVTYTSDIGAVICGAKRRVWLVNEKIDAQTVWGSRIGSIGFC
jgi:hypothetical protein